MCYAALVAADLRRLEREFAALMDIAEFQRLFWARVANPKSFKVPIAIERQFLTPRNEPEADIAAAIAAYRKERTAEWQAEIFKQRRRHADAARKLEQKVTKAAQKDLDVSERKTQQLMKWLEDFRDLRTTEEDAVVYPMHYGPLIIQTEHGRKITPMRYHCRLPGHASEMDSRLQGNYNAFGALVSVS